MKRLLAKSSNSSTHATTIGRYLNEGQRASYNISWNFNQPTIEEFKNYTAEWEFDYKEKSYSVTVQADI